MDELNNFIKIVFNNNERSRHFTLLYTINNLLIINDNIYKRFKRGVLNKIGLFDFIDDYSNTYSELLKYLNSYSSDFMNFQNEIINLFECIDYLIINKDDATFTVTLDKYWAQILINYNTKLTFKKYIDFFIKIKELLKERDKEIICDFTKKYTYFELDTKTNFIDISSWLKIQIKDRWKELKESYEEIDLQKTEKYYSNTKSTKYLYKLENNYYMFDKKTKVKSIIKNFNYDNLGLNNLNPELFRNILTKSKTQVIELLNKNINEIIIEDRINPILVYTLLNKLNIPIIKDQNDNFKFIKFEKWEKINKELLRLNLKKYLTFCINYFNEFNFNLLISQSYNSIDKYLKESDTFDNEEEQVKVLVSNISKSFLLKHLDIVLTVPDLFRKIYKSQNIKLPKYLSQNGGYYFDVENIKKDQEFYNFGSILYEKIYNNIQDLFPKYYILYIKDENGDLEKITYNNFLIKIKIDIDIIKKLEKHIYLYLKFYFQIQEYIKLFDVYGFEKLSRTITTGLNENFIKLTEKLKIKDKTINSLLTNIGNNPDNNFVNSFFL